MIGPDPLVQGPVPPGKMSHEDVKVTPETSSDLA